MTDSPGNRPKPLTDRERREARLAAALRTNLKRRKAASQGKAPMKPEPGDT
jgi:hypothetical protein